jgi:bifunctional non-homologous end joining protein LigD
VPLEAYRKKRNFDQTPEPPGDVRRAARRRRPIFVVQKHDARRLHYDFRLEVNGVLTSWAVPKGPSMNPADKRLAVMTEDHPLEYADFEGIIPEGQYGAGTVMVWDNGWYELGGDVSAARQLARGKLDVALHGRKLRGGFTLIRTTNRSSGRSQARNWLLIKHRDRYGDSSWSIEAPALNQSVLTGRTLNEIAQNPAHTRQRLAGSYSSCGRSSRACANAIPMLSATSSSVANRKIRNTVPPGNQATAIARAVRARRPPIPNFRNRYRTWSRLMPNSSPARA